MRLWNRLLVVGITISLLLLIFQLKLLDLQNCSKLQCWPIFDYENEQSNSTSNFIDINQKRLKTFPSVLIIGAKKGGTRALIDSLQLHPQIIAAKREIHFFDDDSLYSKGLDWYREQMPIARDDQIVIEKTPAYLTKQKCAERVYSFNPQVKLIVIVRDPVIRAISDFSQVQYSRLSKNLSLLNFEECAFKIDNDRTLLNFAFKPISNSLYVKHISTWLAYFPISQFLFVDGDVFIKDPLKELKKVETFLGLKHQIDPSQIVFNENKGFYCFRPRQRRIAKCLGQSKGRKHFQISPISRKQLKHNFRPFNEQFFQLINRRFNWP